MPIYIFFTLIYSNYFLDWRIIYLLPEMLCQLYMSQWKIIFVFVSQLKHNLKDFELLSSSNQRISMKLWDFLKTLAFESTSNRLSACHWTWRIISTFTFPRFLQHYRSPKQPISRFKRFLIPIIHKESLGGLSSSLDFHQILFVKDWKSVRSKIFVDMSLNWIILLSFLTFLYS